MSGKRLTSWEARTIGKSTAMDRSERQPPGNAPERERHPHEESYLNGCQYDETGERPLLTASPGVVDFVEDRRERLAHCRERHKRKQTGAYKEGQPKRGRRHRRCPESCCAGKVRTRGLAGSSGGDGDDRLVGGTGVDTLVLDRDSGRDAGFRQQRRRHVPAARRRGRVPQHRGGCWSSGHRHHQWHPPSGNLKGHRPTRSRFPAASRRLTVDSTPRLSSAATRAAPLLPRGRRRARATPESPAPAARPLVSRPHGPPHHSARLGP